MDIPACCPHCDSSLTPSRSGSRTLVCGESRALFRCRDCGRRFSNDHRGGHRHLPQLVLRALERVCSGYTLAETREALGREFGVEPSKSSISRWAKQHPLPIREVLPSLLEPGVALVHRLAVGQGESRFHFAYHQGKLRFAKKFQGLKRYFAWLEKSMDRTRFEEARNCSAVIHEDLAVGVETRHVKGTHLNHMAEKALTLVSDKAKRHEVVEAYFLYTDRNTVVTELPLFAYDRELGEIVCGQLDLLQVRQGRVLLLDYKPNARKETRQSVMNQLTLYARALHYRASIPLWAMQCAWFDEKDIYYFSPREGAGTDFT